MRRSIQLGLTALVVGASTVAGFEVGGRLGFDEGYCTASKMHEVTNAVMVIGALRAREKGDLDGARKLLESTLESSISTVWLTSQYSPRVQSFAPSLAHADPTPLLKWIAKWRQSHPYEDAYAKTANDWLLARYGTPPQAPQ